VKLSGADLIVRLLERQGISTLAGVPGGANLPLYDALARRGRIRHVLARHEQGAGFIAQGMARALGTPQVCLATSGPGATNVLTAVADARLDSVPLVCLTGQVPLALIGTDAFQEVDTYGMSLPVTKHNYLVRGAGELLEVLPDAFRVAASGRPGPVLIDVPKDVQTQEVEFASWPDPGRPDPPPRFEDGDLRAAAQLLNAARKPILYLGGGVIHSGASPAAVALAEKAGLPTTATLMALGAMPTDHPLYLGMLGMHAARYTNLALEECDLLLAAGARFDDRATGKVAQFCPRAKVIHIDIDPSELGKIRHPQVGIVGDVGEVLRALLPRVRDNPRSAWRARVEELKGRFPLHMPGADDPRTPYGVILHAAALAGADVVVTTDVGQHQMWAAQAYPFRRPRSWLTSGGLGTMGFGLPAAVGAALACPDRTVVCFSGDGSLLMNLQELAVVAEEKVNVKVILLNNNSLGLVRQQQELFYGKRVYAADARSRTDFVRIAEGFGVPAYDLGEGDPAETLARALAGPGPCLVHAPIRPEEKVYPMVPPGAANRDMIGGETRAHTCC
jgi:acetolactate synthase-1/2/3 large subunit